MSEDNPFRILQTDAAAMLVTVPYLADIPIVAENLGDITAAITQGLSQGGLNKNNDGKSGVAISILTPHGRPSDPASPLSQYTTLRFAVFEDVLINRGDAGIGKAALDVHWAIMKAVLPWRRGLGAQKIQFSGWNSRENTEEGTVSYYGDYQIPQIIRVTASNLPAIADPVAPTLSVVASAGSSMVNGDGYFYGVSFVTAKGETAISPLANHLQDNTVAPDSALRVDFGSGLDARILAVRIWRDYGAGENFLRLRATVSPTAGHFDDTLTHEQFAAWASAVPTPPVTNNTAT